MQSTPLPKQLKIPTSVYCVLGGGFAARCAVTGLSGEVLVRAGALADGVVHVAELVAGTGIPATMATAVTLYFMLGASPCTTQLMVAQVVMVHGPVGVGHKVTRYEDTGPTPTGGLRVTVAMVGLVACASAMAGPLQQHANATQIQMGLKNAVSWRHQVARRN